MQIKPGQKGLDATFGYGGHTRKMLEKLEGDGHMYALDIDPIEIKRLPGDCAMRAMGRISSRLSR